MPKTPTTPIRIDRDLWAEFGEATATMNTDRSKAIREFIDWYLGRAGAQPPARPDAGGAAEADGTGPAPVLQIRAWNDIDDGSYRWKPHWDEWEDLDPEGFNVGDIKVQVRVKPKENTDA